MTTTLENRPRKPFQFSLSSVLLVMLVLGVGVALFGSRLRQIRQEERQMLENANRISRLEERGLLTRELFQREENRLSLDYAPLNVTGGTGWTGEPDAFAGNFDWSQKLDLEVDREKIVSLEIKWAALLTEDDLKPIEIHSKPAKHNAQFIDRLKKEYDKHGWSYVEVAESNKVETEQ